MWVLANSDGTGGSPTWTQLSPSGGPSGRFTPSAVYNSTNNRMIVFGGNDVAPCCGSTNDLWVLTNANGLGGSPVWTQLSPSGGPPTVRASHSAVYDASTNRMIVFGGGSARLFNDVWVLSNADGLGGTPNWTQLSPTGGPPAPRFLHSAVYDPTSNRMIIFGGQTTTASQVNEVWVLSNANGLGGTPAWTQLSPAGYPPVPDSRTPPFTTRPRTG